MSTKTLLIVLLVAAAIGSYYGIDPGHDIEGSRSFFDAKAHFGAAGVPLFVFLRSISMWVPFAFLGAAILSLLVKFLFPRTLMLMRGRSAVLLIATMILGPGLLVNGVLKDHYGRPRPTQITEFGGKEHFVPWWDPRGTCERNCSFVSGEAATAFWLIAPAALAPPQWRLLAYGGAIAYGAGVALLRMAFGAHFFTDVFFAGVLVYILIWLTYAWLYRWPSTRPRPGAVEEAIGRAGQAFRAALARPFSRRRVTETPGKTDRRPR